MDETKALARVAANDLKEIKEIGQIFAASGFFGDSRGAAQAVTKILAGRELGLPPFVAMTSLYIIKGRVAISANMMATLVKKDRRYNYKVLSLTESECSIEFYENGQPAGVSTFTMADARKQQTQNIDRFPRNMLFARAMSNGVKWYCPDVSAGTPIYTPDELGAMVNEDGEVITATAEPVPCEQASEVVEAEYVDTTATASTEGVGIAHAPESTETPLAGDSTASTPSEGVSSPPSQKTEAEAVPSVCSACGKSIGAGVVAYSKKHFGKMLCPACQKVHPKASSDMPSEEGASTTGDDPRGGVTKKQLAALAISFAEKGFDEASEDSLLLAKFGVTSKKDLTMEQAGELIDELKNMPSRLPSGGGK